MAKTINGRFNVVTGGLFIGFGIGLYLLKDYQLIKHTPPSPENFDQDGKWKHNSFFKIKFSEGVQPLELKPEAREKVLRELELKKSANRES